jgi:ABC-2 type transport system ATP-binding protein
MVEWGAPWAMPGVDGVEVRGDTILVHSGDTDAIARRLLNQTSARDLEITSRGLEDAFLALTGDRSGIQPGESQEAT